MQEAPNNIPSYPYTYPHYGYGAPSYYNPMHGYPGYEYNNVDYLYYPINQYGQIIGPPTRFPPIINQPHYEPYPHADYISNQPAHGSVIHSPKKHRTIHFHDHDHPPVHRHREKSRHKTLPPIQRQETPSPIQRHETLSSIQKHSLTSTRPVSPNDDGLQRYAVTDLTERGSALSARDALNSIQHYNKLQKSYR